MSDKAKKTTTVKGYSFKDIDKESISIPITCIYDEKVCYGIYFVFNEKPQDPSSSEPVKRLWKITFHSYSAFEVLSKKVDLTGAPALPSKTVSTNRKEKLEKYIKELYAFLCGKKPGHAAFMEFMTKGTPDTKTAIELIKEQREADRQDVLEMLSFIGEVPTAYSWNKPLVCFFGYQSSGKSSIINLLWEMNFRKVGVNRTTNT